MPQRLQGRHILVVEDHPILAYDFADMLKDVGANVIGPATTIEEAERLAQTGELAAALLNIQIGEHEVWPVAHILAGRSIPFAFCSGSTQPLPAEWAQRPLLVKPFSSKTMLTALAELI
jgi:CheY-like chemotaxis protein